MKKNKCLVEEAKEKCQCEWCKQTREWTKLSLEAMYSYEAHRIFREMYEKSKGNKQ